MGVIAVSKSDCGSLLFTYFFIVVLGSHCGIYKSSYNISNISYFGIGFQGEFGNIWRCGLEKPYDVMNWSW
jgi:hypothetical protein